MTEVRNAANIYNLVSASSSAQVLAGSGSGANGDFLDHLVIVPETTAAGTVSITDGSGSAINVLVTGTLADLRPIEVSVQAVSTLGPWKVTTGANVHVIAVGYFH